MTPLARVQRIVHARALAALALFASLAPALAAQIVVSPSQVAVNTQAVTSVFLTYGHVRPDQTAAEAFWCGDLVSAAPDIGSKCDPATLWGQLPLRYDRTHTSGASGITDIMSVPASIGRRAYQAAKNGDVSTFYYVRRFVSSLGLPDEFVVVNCLPTGGAGDVALSLTDVQLAFAADVPVLYVRPGDAPPPLGATITYTGSGRLIGRWEVVRPGEDLPADSDLVTEGTLPPELRGTQRRYTQLERFDVFLPPGGHFVLPGPNPSSLPTSAEGVYLLLLRVEASDDPAVESNLSDVGVGTGYVRSGAVAGFPMPTLRYVVGAGSSDLTMSAGADGVIPLAPRSDATVAPTAPLEFAWLERGDAAFYVLEIETADGTPVHSAVLPRGTGAYRAPSLVRQRANGQLRWRVTALDATGAERGSTPWRPFTLGSGAP